MGVADIIIIAAVAVVFILCVRSFIKNGADPSCASCKAANACSARLTGQGTCSVADKMVADANAALAAKEGQLPKNAK